MQEANNSGNTNPNYTLLSFKPRQVILAERNSETKMARKDHSKTTPTQSSDKKALLIHSILGYLERNGFSKTLNRFLSEAQIENDNWRTCSVDLEEMCCKYLETCENVDMNFNASKEQESRINGFVEKDGDGDHAASEKTISKKKKNSSDVKPAESEKNVVAILANDKVTELKVKSKEKKKSKSVSDPRGQTEQISSEALMKPADDTLCELQVDESNKKYKEKKKKKKKSTLISESVYGNLEKQQLESLQEVIEDKSNHLVSSEGDSKFECEEKAKSKDKKKKNKLSTMNLSENADKENEVLTESTKEIQQTSEDVTNKEKKGSKKRKRLVSKENESQSVDEVAIEDPKRRKTEDLEEAKITEQTSIEHANGKLEKNGEDESALQKTRRKHLNGSAEPKTVNAFQRVKVDDVEFANKWLQDNSYWAKDGAEIGYGAKAQEILGQVRGRDFRHEKTKKKRGSYRGGNIDLHSHSVKFDYSDED